MFSHNYKQIIEHNNQIKQKDKKMSEIDVSKCEKCPFYDEFGAICNMYSCHETNYSITEWQDKCLYKQHQQLKQENKKLDKLEKICTENLENGTKITNLDVLEIIGRNEK